TRQTSVFRCPNLHHPSTHVIILFPSYIWPHATPEVHLYLIPSSPKTPFHPTFFTFLISSHSKMNRFWTLMSGLHQLAGPVTMLLYPLYASVVAIESSSKQDDQQWLSYWILYSFLTLMEMLLAPLLEWVPIWYDVKLIAVAWLVLPQFRGAAFIYDKFVREKVIKRYYPGIGGGEFKLSSPNGNGKMKNKLVDLMTTKKSS
ncbi:TB2/DP1/HVA22-related protein, partial [Cynara cardunculus var. scolymus]